MRNTTLCPFTPLLWSVLLCSPSTVLIFYRRNIGPNRFIYHPNPPSKLRCHFLHLPKQSLNPRTMPALTLLLASLFFTLPICSLICPNPAFPGHGGPACSPIAPIAGDILPDPIFISAYTTAVSRTRTVTGSPVTVYPAPTTSFTPGSTTTTTITSTYAPPIPIPITTNSWLASGSNLPIPTPWGPNATAITVPEHASLSSSYRAAQSSEDAAWSSYGAFYASAIAQFRATASPSAWSSFVSVVSSDYVVLVSELGVLPTGTGTGSAFPQPSAMANKTGFSGNSTHGPVPMNHQVPNGSWATSGASLWHVVLVLAAGFGVIICLL